MYVVVDASAVTAVLFGETARHRVVADIAGRRLVAPPLIEAELANVTVQKVRRGQLGEAVALATFSLFDTLAVEFRPIDYGATAALALATRLTAYDAAYLWLARHLDADLVTLDAELAAAFVRKDRA